MAPTTRADATAHKTSGKVQTLIGKDKDLIRVLDYFRYKNGGATTLMCMYETGILRNSITWYVDYLEKIGELQAIKKDKDPYTGFTAKYYSANQTLWERTRYQELSLF